MTKMVSIKTNAELERALAQEIPADQPLTDLLIVDGTVKGARVGAVFFKMEPYGSCGVFREIEHEEAERFRVRVDHPAFASLNRYFESDYEAGEFARPYESIDGATIDRAKVKVQLDANGKVVAELDADGGAKPLVPQDGGGDEIPF
jgi:hypothetical protein